jgi:lipopolysaccharide biosynthesis protein bplA
MNKIKMCVIGAGNITNSRHIPAIKKNKNFIELIGVIGNNKEKVKKTAQKNKISNTFVLEKDENESNNIEKQLKNLKWFEEVEAVIIGTPPKSHFPLVKACLNLGKNVLVEKPMTMNKDEADELIKISNEKKKVFSVMHNFQFSNGMREIEKRLKNNEFGKIKTISCLQFTNRDRRLPDWYDDLPLGLFYDEAAHFFYLLKKFGGDLKIFNSFTQFDKSKIENTPMILNVNLIAGETPATITMNFNSPVCEWIFILLCEKKIVIYDFFKDIVIIANSDQLHLAKNILKNSIDYTLSFWRGFIKNGVNLVLKNLYYGQDIVIKKFINNINTNTNDESISVEEGRKIVLAMNQVIEKNLNTRKEK